jgi:four helix bundle protein
MADTLEELPIYDKALEFCRSVTAILERQEVRNDSDLWGQINQANGSITANMQEGFEQSTDASFAKYLYYSKGSLGEILARMRQAYEKKYIKEEEWRDLKAKGQELGRMLGGFIRYLARSNFKDRGRFDPDDKRSQKQRSKARRPRPEISDQESP